MTLLEATPDEVAAEAALGGCDPAELAAGFGTPLYVYDLGLVDRQVAALRAALPPNADLAYAVKANPSLGVVAHLAGLGLGADVASRGELQAAIRAGIAPGRIVMTGPGKRDEELEAAVSAGVGVITLESLGELDRLERIAAGRARTIPVLLRAGVLRENGIERVRLVGDAGAGKFGMAPADLAEAARRAARSPHLEVLGVHAFGASNVLDADALADHAEATVALGRRLAADAGFELRLVDVGGGLGIPYSADEAALDLAVLGRRLAGLADRMAGHPLTAGARLLIEPGRFLVGAAGTYLARVVDRKRGDGHEVVILDGGIHHLLRPALTRQSHRVRRLTGARRAAQAVTIAGPLCTGLDVLAADVMVDPPDPGDLVAVLDAGAYGYTESMPYFLSHPVPAEVAVRGGRARLLRARVEPDEWLHTQHVPVW